MGQLSVLEQRQDLTGKLYGNPYDITLYLKRAQCHEELGFPDLAVGDAYKALLLADEAEDESGEYHEQALEAVLERHGQLGSYSNGAEARQEISPLETTEPPATNGPLAADEDFSLSNAIGSYTLRSYTILARGLLECSCLKSAFDFCARGLFAYPQDSSLTEIQKLILSVNRQTQLQRDPLWDESAFDPKSSLPDQGFARRELYPWNNHEPDRFSPSTLSFLNAELSTVAPKLCARSVSLPFLSPTSIANKSTTITQLGLFATEDISPGEIVLDETSLLTATNRLYEPLCDACSSSLPPLSPAFPPPPSCPSCDDTFFCSQSCHDAAMASYHPAVCGTDADYIAKEPPGPASADALYLLLLSRALTLAHTQDTHPLQLKEVKYIWGDFTPSPEPRTSPAPNVKRLLPFSFSHHIEQPLHILTKLDIDIFAPSSLARYDFWVLNTLYAKFRGTASARFSTKGGSVGLGFRGPDVAAVHPLWCLANHSCAPNVRWEWGGRMKLWVRGGDEVVRWGPHSRRQRAGGNGKAADGGEEDSEKHMSKGGIKKGEEILSHYCDVELGMRERREWAMGALGGECLCVRCVWEAAEEEKGRESKTG